MITIKFISKEDLGQVTVKESQVENVIHSLIAVGYRILEVEK